MKRSEITHTLKDAAISFWAHKKYSCFPEIAVNRWGKLRADILAVNFKGKVLICEVKSCKADYISDNKWKHYLEYCDKFYFVMRQTTFEILRDTLKTDLKGTGAGVLILDPNTGYLKSAVPSKERSLNEGIRYSLILRMAWRSGISVRTRRRRVRHFI